MNPSPCLSPTIFFTLNPHCLAVFAGAAWPAGFYKLRDSLRYCGMGGVLPFPPHRSLRAFQQGAHAPSHDLSWSHGPHHRSCHMACAPQRSTLLDVCCRANQRDKRVRTTSTVTLSWERLRVRHAAPAWEHLCSPTQTTPPPPCISYALVQATVGVGTVYIWDLILIRYQT